MRKIGMLVALFVVASIFLGFGKANAQEKGRGVLRDDQQFLFFPLEKMGSYDYVPGRFIHSPMDIPVNFFSRATWNSDRSFWIRESGSRSSARMVITLGDTKYLVFNVEGTFDSDRGNWILWAPRIGKYFWVDQEELALSGYPTRMVGDLLQYGDYRRPKLSVSSPGTMVLKFNTNGIIGFQEYLTVAEVRFIRWESDGEGWGAESNKTCIPEEVPESGGRIRCEITGLQNSIDRGLLYAILKDSRKICILPQRWNLSDNVVINDDSTLTYELP